MVRTCVGRGLGLHMEACKFSSQTSPGLSKPSTASGKPSLALGLTYFAYYSVEALNCKMVGFAAVPDVVPSDLGQGNSLFRVQVTSGSRSR
jgi:hypothetical protein